MKVGVLKVDIKAYRFEEMKEGLTEGFSVDISEEMIDSFARLSGDYNPLHLDHEFARSKGFETRVVHGLLTASFYSRLVGMFLPGRDALLHGIDVKFFSAIAPRARLRVSGQVSHVNPAYRQIELKARIEDGKQTKISTALIKVGFTSESSTA